MQITKNMDDMTLSVIKSEQYTRRDTVTVVGLPMLDDTPESQSELTAKVAEVLSNSGETVAASDLSAVHRNSKASKEIRGKRVPPSVTVKFSMINKKDAVLRQYKNYDPKLKKTRDVRVFQSLSEHYATVRKSIYDFFNSKDDSRDFTPIFNPGFKVKWVTYQSPSSGFAIKLQSGEYFKGIHTWHEFIDTMLEKFPTCRIMG